MAKILMHTLVFPPDANSNAYIFADLAKEFKKGGHEIVVLTTTPHYAIDKQSIERQPLHCEKGGWLFRSDFEGISCYHISVPPKKAFIKERIKSALRFHILGFYLALKSEFKCDIVISQSPPLSIGFVSALIAKRHRAKSIYIIQDIFPDGLIHQGKIKNPLFIAFLRILERMVYYTSDAVCSISDGLVDVIRPRVPKKTILKTVPNFVNTELYRPLPRDNDFSRDHSLNDKFVVSYVGNLGNAQDFTPVISAAMECRDLSIKFLLVGGGIKEKSLGEEIRQKGLDNIKLLGYQPRELTPYINAASDICLVLLSPHIRNFSFPSKVYTLMACGRPIILYGNPDSDASHLIRDTQIGWVVENGNTDEFINRLKLLYQNREMLKKSGDRAVESVMESYTVKAVAQKYNELIELLLDPKRSANAA